MTEKTLDENLRKEYRRLKESHRSCPEKDEFGRYLRGEIFGEEQLLLEFHLNTCARCIELTDRLAAAGAPQPASGPAASDGEKFEREMARKLGFHRPGAFRALISRLGWLWTVKTPLLLPAGVALLFLGLLLYPGLLRTGPGEISPELLPVTRITIDQTAVRAGTASGEISALRAGEVALVTVYLEGYGHPPGEPVRCRVRDAAGGEVLNMETAVLEDLSIQVALRLPASGNYQVGFLTVPAGEPLEELELVVSQGPR